MGIAKIGGCGSLAIAERSRLIESAPASNPLDGTPQIRTFLERPTVHSHIVQFYERETALIENVVEFMVAGLRAGEPVIAIATPEHRAAFAEGLGRHGFGEHTTEHGITLLDARETLATFMEGDAPRYGAFFDAIGTCIERALQARPAARVRAYGEMVDRLWRDNHRAAAITLETYWNELGERYPFSLLCAYVMDNFVKASDASAFREVCATHSHVIPAESYSLLPEGEDRMRAISELQQRAQSLAHELEHRKELEKALRESLAREQRLREQAERNVHFADIFAGMLGHDLRNPLGTITMGADYIVRSSGGERVVRAATRIATSADRMERMISQLLDFTRIRAAGGLQLLRDRIELAEVCERAKDEIEAANPQCTIALETSGNTDGMWDRDRLLQVFSNLLGNAVTHGTSGCHVTIEADGQDSSTVTAYVRNDGVVDPTMLPVIFDPFRGGKKRHNAKGLGLGLYISRQIVIAHGGEIAITSGQSGTLVCIKLPRFFTTTAQNDSVKV